MTKKKSKHKKRDTDKILTIVIVSVLIVVCSVSYIRQKKMLKEYGVTTCVVVSINNEPGTRWGYQYNVCYYVNDKKYHQRFSVSKKKYRIGDKFRIKYSIKDPDISEVLWDERVMDDSLSIQRIREQ